ncbi:MAG: 54S ribosomal protein L23, mitochondrial [Ramalina farinacea]|uniref:Large ribosomal subunit protein uL13m n=1 Tax=Ramalina farinacea TaxID=258253 RepID=A0AA43QG82_9LECA|nr:54S ribosomal protein L23, mitochondrial [Ramalina farinacea]
MSQIIGRTRLAYARTWHHVSLSTAKAPPLGRLASQIAILLMGKHKPIWDPSTDCGDYVVATGCTDVYATGKKLQQKLYYKQTTRPGALKSLNMEGMIKKWGGGEVLKRAVSGMLPKNRLRKPRLERLKVFEGEAHPYGRNLIRFEGKKPKHQPTLEADKLKTMSV